MLLLVVVLPGAVELEVPLVCPLAAGVCAYTAWIPAIENDDTTGTANAVPTTSRRTNVRRSGPTPSTARSRSDDTAPLLRRRPGATRSTIWNHMLTVGANPDKRHEHRHFGVLEPSLRKPTTWPNEACHMPHLGRG